MLKTKCCIDVRTAKQNFVVEEVISSKDDVKAFWSAMKELVPSKGKKSRQINLVSEDKCIDTADVPDFINDFFANIGPELAKDLHIPWKQYDDRAPNSIDPFETNSQEVLKLIHDIM